jgi:hypothetical protein
MKGSGLLAPALFMCGAGVGPAFAQSAPAPQASPGVAPASAVPVPDDLTLAKLIWVTMAAVDNANQAGNYSVLRDLAAPGFQINNDAAKLTQIFATLRASGIDLSNTLLLAPTYSGPPTIPQPGIFRVRGYFGLRPTAIMFDLHYQWIYGKWRLFGVSIAPATMTNVQPAPQSPPPRR